MFKNWFEIFKAERYHKDRIYAVLNIFQFNCSILFGKTLSFLIYFAELTKTSLFRNIFSSAAVPFYLPLQADACTLPL